MDKEMIVLVSRFKKYLEERSEQQLRCFHKYESQVEGWFKGELLFFLDREKRKGRLHDFQPEMKLDLGGKRKRKIDIWIQFDNSGSRISWVELKHWIRNQNGTDWYGNYWYFKTNHSSCVKPDVEKLLKIPGDGDKFMLVLCTDNPRSNDWNSGVQEFNKRFSQNLQCFLNSLTNPDDYPEYFFLGLLHVAEKDQH
jgi:hypothetical protein